VDDRVEQGDRVPRLGERFDRVKSTAEEGQRGDHQHREDLQLLEILGPHADRKAEQAKSRGDPEQEQDHRERVIDLDGHEQDCRRQRD
jgi:hypothetical protein